MSQTRRLASMQAAADMLSVHPDTIRNMISRGDLTGYRLPGKARTIRVDLDELDAVLRPVRKA